jgi:pimeloyl-ACP methyl ester carboxylesterase/DNA-binding CsgD family transcriptional regulator
MGQGGRDRPADAGTAAGFLKELARAALSGQPLFAFADNQEGFAAALDAEPDALDGWLHGLSDGGAGTGTVAEVRASAFASMALSADGRQVVGDPRLDDLAPDPRALTGLIQETTQSGAPSVGILDDGGGLPMAVALAGAPRARQWPLQKEVRAALEAGRAEFALIAFSPQARDWLVAARAYGLTPAETRLVSALARTGELRAACAHLGISYQTGRKSVASVLRKTRSARQPEMLRQTLAITAGALRPPDESDGLFADLFNLRARQARLARHIAQGLTREQAASVLGIGPSLAKDDLSAVFAATGVTSALGLGRVFAEVEALRGLANACDVTIHRGLSSPDPVRFVPRKTRSGRIALADHGPSDGRPVLIFHTTTGGRAQSPGTLLALREAGYRAIVIERPGFGLSDPAGPDQWLGAAMDVGDVLDELAIPQAVVLARGGARLAVMTGARLGGRVLGGVLVGPDSPPHLDRSFSGVIGQTKLWMYSRPAVIRSLAALMSNQTSTAAIARLMRASVERSLVDQAVLTQPGELDALVRGGRQSALGMVGFAAEMEAMAANRPLPAVPASQRWTILFGDQDRLFNASDARAWWQEVMRACRSRS